jgi:predicted RND superfamily exporter protein
VDAGHQRRVVRPGVDSRRSEARGGSGFFFSTSDPGIQQTIKIEQRFSSQPEVILTVSSRDISSPRYLGRIQKLTQRVHTIGAVSAVYNGDSLSVHVFLIRGLANAQELSSPKPSGEHDRCGAELLHDARKPR